MKQFIIFIAFVAISSTSLFAQDNKANNIDNSNIALEGYSPVSYADLSLAQKGVKEFKATHEGITYYLTSAEQKVTFEKNPEKYLPQYGGYCAYGVAKDSLVKIEPENWMIVEDKLYLNYNDDFQQLWEEDIAGFIATADAKFESLLKNQ